MSETTDTQIFIELYYNTDIQKRKEDVAKSLSTCAFCQVLNLFYASIPPIVPPATQIRNAVTPSVISDWNVRSPRTETAAKSRK